MTWTKLSREDDAKIRLEERQRRCENLARITVDLILKQLAEYPVDGRYMAIGAVSYALEEAERTGARDALQRVDKAVRAAVAVVSKIEP